MSRQHSPQPPNQHHQQGRHDHNVSGARVRMRTRDVIAQALGAPVSNLTRTLLTALGTVLGVGALVITFGLVASAQGQVDTQLRSFLATEVDLRTNASSGTHHRFTAADAARATQLPGVQAAGITATADDVPLSTSGTPAAVAAAVTDGQTVTVVGVSAGALKAIDPGAIHGATLTPTTINRGSAVAMIGLGAASEIGLDVSRLPKTVFLNGRPFLIVGTFRTTQRMTGGISSMLIPLSAAAGAMPPSTPREMIVGTKPGYAAATSSALPAWIAPAAPTSVIAQSPPDLTGLGQNINTAVNGLLLALGGIGLVIGMIGIANTTLVSVLERQTEIGLRRAIGARRGQIATQFLIESLAIGLIGGIIGASLGLLTVMVVALGRGWSPVEPITVVALAPIAGALAGALAGVYPAARAARIEPAIALGT